MSRIYVGNLPIDVKEAEIDDLFYKYGRIREIDLKTPARPPAFAFISFEDARDAEDAVRARDGYNYDGYRLRCEFAKGGGGGGGFRDDIRERPRGGGGRRTDYGVTVSNLPKGCSWQDLKDFMRKAGDVVFTDVDKYGDGVVEFSNKDDMDYAVGKMDDTEFRGHNDSTFIRIKRMKKDRSESRDRGGRGRSPVRDRSPARDRNERSRSPADRSRSRDRKKRSASRSVEKSRSRSPPRRSRSRSAEDEDKKKIKEEDKKKIKEEDKKKIKEDSPDKPIKEEKGDKGDKVDSDK
jgi:arginine/serine-rich splicing factor 1/9